MFDRLKGAKVMKKDKNLLSKRVDYFLCFVIYLSLKCALCLEFIDKSVDDQIFVLSNASLSAATNKDDHKNYFNYNNKGWSCECHIIVDSLANVSFC